jgi:hypothetical protein
MELGYVEQLERGNSDSPTEVERHQRIAKLK